MIAAAPDRIASGAAALDLDLCPEIIARLHAYLDQLEKWNRAYNLTAIRDRREMEVEHVLDSLSVAPFLATSGETVVDVGTGAGIPGLVLAIAIPANNYVLVDSNGKKTRFLAQVVQDLGLGNVLVRHRRVEDLEPLSATTVISRAFSRLDAMVAACGSLLAPGSRLLAMKGNRPDDEIAALPDRFSVRWVRELKVPGLAKSRHLVCIGLSDVEGSG